MDLTNLRPRHWLSVVVPVLPLLLSLNCGPRPHKGARSAPAGSASASASSSSSKGAGASSSASASASTSASTSASASASVISAKALPPLPDPSSVALDQAPELARVSFLSAVIGPGRVGGTQWGRVDFVPDDIWKEVAKRMRADDSYSAMTAFLAEGGFATIGTPDIKGRVTLLQPLGDKSLDLPEVDDTFTPRWSAIEFRKVPLEKRTRLRIEFVDALATKDATIGIAELDGAALMKIDAAGKIVAWPFADQTQNQVLFVMVSVVPE